MAIANVTRTPPLARSSARVVCEVLPRLDHASACASAHRVVAERVSARARHREARSEQRLTADRAARAALAAAKAKSRSTVLLADKICCRESDIFLCVKLCATRWRVSKAAERKICRLKISAAAVAPRLNESLSSRPVFIVVIT